MTDFLTADTSLQSARTEKSAMTVSGCVLLLLQSVSQKVLPVLLFPDKDQPVCGSSGQNNLPDSDVDWDFLGE